MVTPQMKAVASGGEERGGREGTTSPLVPQAPRDYFLPLSARSLKVAISLIYFSIPKEQKGTLESRGGV